MERKPVGNSIYRVDIRRSCQSLWWSHVYLVINKKAQNDHTNVLLMQTGEHAQHLWVPLKSLCSDKSGVNQPQLVVSQNQKELNQLQQGSGNAAKERPLTSSLKWPHESGHQAVGGVDLSSARHHLTPVAVYLARSLPDTNWCRRLFALLLSSSLSHSLFFFFFYLGSWCSLLSLSLSGSHKLPPGPAAACVPPRRSSVSLSTTWLFVLLCVFLAITRSLSLCLFLSGPVCLFSFFLLCSPYIHVPRAFKIKVRHSRKPACWPAVCKHGF